MKKILLLILVVALVAGAVGVLRNGIPENVLFAGGSGSASSGSGGGNTIKR